MTFRWMTAFLAAALAHGALSAGAGAAQIPSTQPTSRPSATVLALVHDLTSDQFSTRQIAQNKLEQMGEEVSPQLRELLQEHNLSDEAAARIRTALLRIQEGLQFGPSVITIHCHDAPLAGVLQDFASQAGADLGVDRPEIHGFVQARKISLDLDHVDFWTALRAIEEGSGLHARPENGSGRMILDNSQGWFQGWSNRSRVFGPCLIFPQSVAWSINFGAGPNFTSNLTLQLAVMHEPKLRVVAMLNGNWLRTCVDERGHNLVAQAPAIIYSGYSTGMGQWWMNLPANLQVVPGMGKKIAKLTGEVELDVQTKAERIDVDDLPSVRDLARTAGQYSITIHKFVLENGQYQLHLLIGGAAAASGRMDIVQQNLMGSLQILDEKDHPLQCCGYNSSGLSNGQMSMTVDYFAAMPAGPLPKKLRWEITTETRRIKVPFELDDIDLPHAGDEVH